MREIWNCFGFTFTVNFRGKPLKSKVTLSSSLKIQNVEIMAYKSKERDCLLRPQNTFVQNTLPKTASNENIAIRSFFGTLFQASSTCPQERRGTILKFWLESCKPAIRQQQRKTSECPPTSGRTPRPSKLRLVFRSKTFPKNDALTQKRSNVQDNSDATKESLNSIPSVRSQSVFFGTFSWSHQLSSHF